MESGLGTLTLKDQWVMRQVDPHLMDGSINHNRISNIEFEEEVMCHLCI